MPFFWTTLMAKHGSIAGNQALAPLSIQMAVVTLTLIPILVVYPFVQRHFVKGMLIGEPWNMDCPPQFVPGPCLPALLSRQAALNESREPTNPTSQTPRPTTRPNDTSKRRPGARSRGRCPNSLI